MSQADQYATQQEEGGQESLGPRGSHKVGQKGPSFPCLCGTAKPASPFIMDHRPPEGLCLDVICATPEW
jgi:hypothetical protein